MSLPKDTLSSDQEQLLYKLYYDDHLVWGRDRLYKYITENHPEYNISRRMVWNWLADQEIHQRFAPAKRTKDIQSTILKEPKKQIGIDLVNMEHYEHDGYKYILTCVDLFSKKAYAKAMKNKEESTVTAAMKQLIDDQIHYVSTIRSDRGSEFIAKGFQDMLKSFEIKQVLSLPGKPQSNGVIERLNKTLKRALVMVMTINKNHNWVDTLQDVVDNYNNTISRVTGKNPNDLDIEDDKKVLKDVKNKISSSVTSRNEKDEVKFNVGDKVRLKNENPINGENWSKQLYEVYEVVKPRNKIAAAHYFIKNGNEKFNKKYYNNDLLYISDVKNIIDEPKKFEISKIVKPLIHNKSESYIVRWKGYKEADNTIEPRKNLLEDVPKLIRKFERDNHVEWKNGRVYWDGQTHNEIVQQQQQQPQPKKIVKNIVPQQPIKQNETVNKIINSNVSDKNIVDGKRERKKKVIMDL